MLGVDSPWNYHRPIFSSSKPNAQHLHGPDLYDLELVSKRHSREFWGDLRRTCRLIMHVREENISTSS